MIIAGIQRTSTIDFPGQLACVLFTRGCDMNCFYCHNRELIGTGGHLPEEEVEDFLQRRRGLLDGVVLSGGEPTLQPDLPQFLLHLRELGYRVKLDTNGLRPEVVEFLLRRKLLDYAAVDWKAPREKYEEVCGAPDGFDRARRTLLLLAESGIPFEGRTTLYPGLTFEELCEMAAALPPLPCYRLNLFRQPEQFLEKDRQRLDGQALTRSQIEARWDELARIQPHLTV